jgi:hypothetical protein
MGNFLTKLGLVVASLLAIILVVQVFTVSISTISGETVDAWLTSNGYVAYGASPGLTAGQVPYATGANNLASESGFEYNATTDTFSVLNINAPTGRTASVVIAASNAPAIAKVQADVICDGTADNVEIQAVVTAAAGGYVQLTEGTFYIAAALALPSNTTLSGMGRTTILKSTAADSIIYLNNTRLNVTVQNLYFEGDSIGVSGIQFKGAGLKLLNVESANFTSHGIYGNDAASGSIIENCRSHNNSSGIALFNSPYNITVKNCISYSNTYHGVTISGGSHNSVVGGSYYLNGYNGVMIGANTTHSIVSGTHCYTNGRTYTTWGFNGICIFGANANYNSVIGNTCEDNGATTHGGHGISIDGSNATLLIGCIVEGNICRNNAQQGIELIWVTDSEIHGNICVDNNNGEISNGSGICLVNNITYTSIHDNKCFDTRVTPLQKYGIYEMAGVANSNNDIKNNTVKNNLLSNLTKTNSSTAYGNYGWIAQGEIRSYSGNITTLTQNAYNSVDNPFGQAVGVISLTIYISTNATATAPNIDCGIGSSATTDYTTLFNDLPGETIGYYVSTITTPGAQTVPIVWTTGAGNRYLNMSIKDAAATGMVATYIITVIGQ